MIFRCDRGDYRVLTTIAHGLRVHRAPGIPHALCFPGGGKFLHNSGASRHEGCRVSALLLTLNPEVRRDGRALGPRD